jgi:hypothetical protein
MHIVRKPRYVYAEFTQVYAAYVGLRRGQFADVHGDRYPWISMGISMDIHGYLLDIFLDITLDIDLGILRISGMDKKFGSS